MIVTFGDVPLTTMDSLFSVYGEFRTVGPGICGANAAFVSLGFDGSAFTGAGVNSVVSTTGIGAVAFQGGCAGAIVPRTDNEGQYT